MNEITNHAYEAIVGADFSGEDLSCMDFTGSKLKDCNFSGADLSDAFFKDATLEGCKLDGVKMDCTDMTNCRIEKSSISKATIDSSYFKDAEFLQCDLSGTNFTNDDSLDLYFGACDISNCSFDVRNADLNVVAEMSKISDSHFFGRPIASLYFSESELIDSSIQGSLEDGHDYAFTNGSKIEGSAFFVDLNDMGKIDFSGCAKIKDVETAEGFELPEIDEPCR